MREESVPPVRFRRAAVSDMEPVAGMYRAAVSAMESVERWAVSRGAETIL